ncbi:MULTISPECIES: ABC transporter substrate-binding protein [Rhodococcus]|uniref:ABC transporter substrate-binding protein n=1 Tax=Rhodococcus oxybenzonivorans TaxID=1990687 RepID=A0AAE4V3Y7_9NOCA|nr:MULTISPECIES: ABC transporter substrate-binding protein [Rhodococcus]MDV7243098.1 ABC transporter substrate-binding protein [Rhodococcus oxybenzonivorans]MDV7267709.1 ABC transporter substrate-binding protein [Rhodococcus oxybenzonivorans]MDV7275502.1 ABC transporter substrate-binding protein [Rhodococcus oxybenzonivorans]MDV7334643.1 ABC transporter substrate-binding protein [Rhodococcus oxybenzonivorans]MDV7344797.1 ABC transporter substrate-binding protein [Rhodococcus oxybenzonivorans]
MTVTTGPALDTLWYTRCPVPTASGLANNLGWLGRTADAAGVGFGVLQDAGPELAVRHFDHRLPGLIREGGNVPALAARAEGSPTRLIGLTWIDEAQAILVRPESGIRAAADLAGLRVGIPAWAADRARSFPRAMALHGVASALRLGGLSFADVKLVEVATTAAPQVRTANPDRNTTWGIESLLAGDVDAVYVKGARAQDVARQHGLVVAVDLDSAATLRDRVNNGTPRPVTVHADLLEHRPDIVIGFLAESLRAADWAAANVEQVRAIFQTETQSGPEGVVAAYGENFHEGLHLNLSEERVDLLGVQKQFLYAHGFLASDFDLESWVAREPLEQATAQLAAEKEPTT